MTTNLISTTFSIISCKYFFCFFVLTGLETQHFEDFEYWIFVTISFVTIAISFIIKLCSTTVIHNT